MEKILIIRLSSIGDIIQCSAVPRHLKTRFPEAEIHWLVRSDNKELVEHNRHLSKVIPFDRAQGFGGWLKLARAMAGYGYTHIYDAHNNIRSHIFCWIVRSKMFVRRSKHRFKRVLLFWLKLNLFGTDIRGVDSYLSPLRQWGVQNDHQAGELFLPPATIEKVRGLLPQSQNGEWIAIAPATAWPKKTWPEIYWINLVGRLLAETRYNIVILGGPKDDFCSRLVLDSKRVFSLQGKLSLLESAAAAALCRTLIAADTGVLHMAESLQKDVVAILGPTPFGHPVRERSIGLQKSLWCQPCSKDGRGPCINKTYQKCMKLIEPEEVLTAVTSLLERERA